MKLYVRLYLLLLIVFFPSVLFAGSYNAQLVTIVDGTSTGMGKVYSGTTDKVEGEFEDIVSYSEKQDSDKKDVSLDFYAFAEVSDSNKYLFEGWSTTDNGPIEYRDNPQKISILLSDVNNTKTLYAHFVEKKEVVIDFILPEVGEYSASVNDVAIDILHSVCIRDEISFCANVPDGYKFLGWYYIWNGVKIYFSLSESVSHVFVSDVSVGMDVVKDIEPIFVVDGKYPFVDLNDANAAACESGEIVLVSDGVLKEGEYHISKGVTLLIPFDEKSTCYRTDVVGVHSWEIPSVYRTLTMDVGAKLIVEGTLSISAMMYSQSGSENYPGGGVTGKYGLIKMNEGSSIDVCEGGIVYAWGYITGEGRVTAYAGSKIYEGFEIMDFKGGQYVTAVQQEKDKKVFPFNQYYVQNIEVPLMLYYGASERVISSVYASKAPHTTGEVEYIGKSGLFILNEGAYIVKRYDGTVDRQVYELYGNVTLGDICVKLNGVIADSKGYVLPISNNYSIKVEDGALSLGNENGVAMLPGVEIVVKEKGKLVLGNGSLFVYDSSEWGKYAGMQTHKKLPYSPTRTYDRKSVADAVLDIRGTLLSEGTGCLYTTVSGARVCCSQGSGTIVFSNGSGDENVTWQAAQNGTSPLFEEIAVVSAKLTNADGSYMQTVGSNAGATFYYVGGHWTATMPDLIPGDLDNDGMLTMNDVELLSGIVVGNKSESANKGVADVNGDGIVSIADVVCLLNIIAK